MTFRAPHAGEIDVRGHDAADEVARLLAENEQLQTALDSRIGIERAKGVLAERLEVSIEEAFAVLRYSARSARMPLAELAAQLVPAAAMPQAIIRGLAREARWRALALCERSEASREHTARLRAAVEEQAERIARARGRGPGVDS